MHVIGWIIPPDPSSSELGIAPRLLAAHEVRFRAWGLSLYLVHLGRGSGSWFLNSRTIVLRVSGGRAVVFPEESSTGSHSF